jgi:hypothetical protein
VVLPWSGTSTSDRREGDINWPVYIAEVNSRCKLPIDFADVAANDRAPEENGVEEMELAEPKKPQKSPSALKANSRFASSRNPICLIDFCASAAIG